MAEVTRLEHLKQRQARLAGRPAGVAAGTAGDGWLVSIYHLSAKVISRGAGQSVVAAAAYQSRERLYDERDGQTKDYS